MPPTRVKPEDLSPAARLLVLETYQQILRDLSDHDINGVQITLDGKDQPPTIDVRYV